MHTFWGVSGIGGYLVHIWDVNAHLFVWLFKSLWMRPHWPLCLSRSPALVDVQLWWSLMGGGWWSCVSHDGNECGAMPKLSQQSLTKRESVILCRVAELTYSHKWNVEYITIANTPRHTHMTGKNKQSCKFPETQHTSQNITHSHLSANFFCSLGIFSFILFHSVRVGATCALVKLLTWMALSVSVWLDTSENRVLCCRGIWLFLPSSQKVFSNPKCLCK